MERSGGQARRAAVEQALEQAGGPVSAAALAKQFSVSRQIIVGDIALLRAAVHSLGLSARAYTRILRLARTIADLDDSDSLRGEHLAEAISLRVLDRPAD